MGFRQGNERDYERGRWRHYRCKCGTKFERFLRDPLAPKDRLCDKCLAVRRERGA